MKDLIKKRQQHGGDIYTSMGEGVDSIIDLSSNINPREIPAQVYSNLKDILDKAKSYPDIEYRELKSSLSKYINSMLGDEITNINDFVIGNGAVEVIDKTIASFDNIIIPRPSFIEYELSAIRYSKGITFIDRDINKDFNSILDESFIDEIISKVTYKNSLVVICNPNNPDGFIYDIAAVEKLLTHLRSMDSFLLADETFSEFIGDLSKNVLTLIGEYHNLIIVKALTKFFGLPGVRLGYGITKNHKLIEDIIKKQTTWNVGTFAQEIAMIMLKDEEYIQKSIEDNNKNKRHLSNVLEESNLFSKIYKSHGDFICVELKENYNPMDLINHLKENGILIRSLFNMKPFDKRYFRIAVKREDAINRLNDSLKEFKIKKDLTNII